MRDLMHGSLGKSEIIQEEAVMNSPEIVKEKIQLTVPGSSPMAAYVARPASAGRHPGLIVFQEAFGVNGHICNVTERFAAQGYVAIAPELFHRAAASEQNAARQSWALTLEFLRS